MLNFKTEFYLKIILLISLTAIISAYFIEYILGHQPCNLCIIERIPYILSVIVLLINYRFKKFEKYFILLLLIIFFVSMIISIYHFGIEQDFFQESSVCGLRNTAEITTKEELLKQLNERTASCKDVTFRIFGLSLTSINIFISLIIIIILTKAYISYEKIKP